MHRHDTQILTLALVGLLAGCVQASGMAAPSDTLARGETESGPDGQMQEQTGGRNAGETAAEVSNTAAPGNAPGPQDETQTDDGGAVAPSDLRLVDSDCGPPSQGGLETSISSFEQGEATPMVRDLDGRGGVWFTYPESVSLSLVSPGAGASQAAVRARSSEATETDSGVGLQLNGQGMLSCAHNATAFAGLSFWIRGEGLEHIDLQVAQGWSTPAADGGTCDEDCYNHHRARLQVSTDWQRIELVWDDLRRPGWGQALPFDPRQLTQLIWTLPGDGAATLEIDDVAFLPGGDIDPTTPPGYSEGSGSPSTPAADPHCAPESRSLDDFEVAAVASARWYTTAEAPGSTASLTSGRVSTRPEGGQAMRVRGSGYGTVQLVRSLEDAGICFDPEASGLRLMVGSEDSRELILRVALSANTPVDLGGSCSFTQSNCASGGGDCCHDFHEARLQLQPGWQSYEVPFTDFYQSGFGRALDLDLSEALRLEFHISPANSFDIWIDDLELLPPSAPIDAGPACASSDGNLPFGARPHGLTSAARRPSNATDQAVQQAYQQWAQRYLLVACGGHVVDTSSDTGSLTVSEAMGYGMLLTAYMNDHARFDGLWQVTRYAPSEVVPEFMSWRIGTDCDRGALAERHSATDGDMDIAYALLLADRQWGSEGDIDYRERAREIVDRLAQWALGPEQRFIKLGDWVGSHSGSLETTMRPSDFMPDHFRAFEMLTGDPRWGIARTKIYEAILELQSDGVGLVTDFVTATEGTLSAVGGDLLEGPADGTYALNASRVPWRIGVDYLVSGDDRARDFLQTLTHWARDTSGSQPQDFLGKYWPDGDSYSDDTRGALFYTGPLGVGAMASDDQIWLDALWDYTRGHSGTVYYQDTLRVLSMVAMSGNWWSPARLTCD